MFARVAVVSHVPGLGCEDAVVAAELAVFTGEPRCAALAEDDVSGDDEFACGTVVLAWLLLLPYSLFHRVDS